MAAAIGYPLHHLGTTPLRERHHHAIRHLVVVGCVVAAVLAGVGNAAPAESLAAASVSFVSKQSDSAAPVTEESTARLQSGLSTAREVLSSSEGRVLDEVARTRLGSLVGSGDEAIRVGRMLAAIAEPGRMPEFATSLADTQFALAGLIETATSTVESSVAAWEVEQARIAAEKEAARVAAEAAARAQNRVRPAGVAIPAGPHVEGVWTSGGQAEIDACRGSVNLADVAGYLGGTFYAAEHWSCGGRVWAGIGTGELVNFPGFGLYQVTGQIGGLPSGSYASSLPSGYDGYYQTCMHGNVNNLHVWLLTRVG